MQFIRDLGRLLRRGDFRRLFAVRLGDVDLAGTEQRFTMLMGKGEAAARRAWIEERGNEVEVDI